MKVFKYHFSEKESDITIISESKSAILKAQNTFYNHREKLEKFVLKHNEFLISFSPIKIKSDLKIIQLMSDAAFLCDVGPMATVAGALADLMLFSMKTDENPSFNPAKVCLIENGGEIAIDSEKEMKVALFAGYNKLNLNIGFLILPSLNPMGIGTSSSTFGHAVSLGQADVATVFADNAALADGAATKTANLVKGVDIEKSIKNALDNIGDIEGVRGAFICRENKIGQVGKIPEIFKIEGKKSELLKGKVDDSFMGDFEIFK